MILVDTSVWTLVFRRRPRLKLEDLVELDEVVTCLPVLQEVLQGFDDERAFNIAREAMLALPLVESPLSSEVFLEAVSLYRSARRLGVSVRSGVDCLVAACALRHGLLVLHQDRDYDQIARIAPLSVRRVPRGS